MLVGETEAGAVGVLPLVDGRAFTLHALDFELAQGWDAAGGYGALIPDDDNVVDLSLYMLGRSGAGQEHGRVWILGCICGEVGCWPLEATVTADEATVTWSNFAQPHRPDRDYADFGPYVFTRSEYEAEVAAAAVAVLAAYGERLPGD